jgi:hypothetical protein
MAQATPLHGGQEVESGEETRDLVLPSMAGLSDLLLPTRPHILKFLQLPKIVTPAGDQMFNTQTSREHFIFKPHQ